jgi:hypothetical protein
MRIDAAVAYALFNFPRCNIPFSKRGSALMRTTLTLSLLVFALSQACRGQQAATPTTQPDATITAAPPQAGTNPASLPAKPAASTSSPANPEAAAAAPVTWSTGSSVGSAPASDAKEAHTGKKKAAYAGPTELIVLPPKPILDEHGQQKLDSLGRPMFSAPDVQLQDKDGHPRFDRNGKPVFASTSRAAS